MRTYFKTETEDHSLGKILSEKKKYGAMGLVSATGEFLQYIYSIIVDKNHQTIRSRCLAHEFSFTDIL